MTLSSVIRPRLAAPAPSRFFSRVFVASTLLLACGVAAAANTAPTISGTPSATATAGQSYSFTPSAHDADGNALRFSIANKPGWMSFSASTGRLYGKPGTALVGKTWSNVSIKVSDGTASRALAPFSITVKGGGTPVITGTPTYKVATGTKYSFKPKAWDPNGNTLSFRIANKPAWATFSTSTGLLSGTPKAANVGWYGGITISVTDGKTTANLAPFGVKVTSGSGTTNSPPKISGSPPTFAKVGQPYAFKPTASDPDGDALSFGISNKPAWAKFDTSNGTLYGTPTSANVGKFANITIRVSDGKTTSTLPAYTLTVGTSSTINVTLRWSQPTTNTDGSKLTDLAGYKIYYGTASRTYPNVVNVPGAASTSVVLEGLQTGRTWYFAIKSYDTSGTLSPFSAEVKAAL